MATIDKDGVYKDDAQYPNFFQYRKGTEVGDVKLTYVGPFPDPVDPRTFEEVKADTMPAHKAAAAPVNKQA